MVSVVRITFPPVWWKMVIYHGGNPIKNHLQKIQVNGWMRHESTGSSTSEFSMRTTSQVSSLPAWSGKWPDLFSSCWTAGSPLSRWVNAARKRGTWRFFSDVQPLWYPYNNLITFHYSWLFNTNPYNDSFMKVWKCLETLLSVIESSFSGFWGPKIFQLASFAMPRNRRNRHASYYYTNSVGSCWRVWAGRVWCVEKWSVLAAGLSGGTHFLAGFVEVGRHHQKPMWISIRLKKLLKVIFWKNPKRSTCNYWLFSAIIMVQWKMAGHFAQFDNLTCKYPWKSRILLLMTAIC